MTSLPVGSAVTFLFTDIEGSTRLERTVGSATWAEVVADHDARLRTAIEGAGGQVVKTEGDAVFAAFAEPCAAIDAVIAGFRALSGAPFAGGTEVRVRAGLHTGVGRLRTDLAPDAAADYVGIDVNYAARVAAAANGGQVLLSDALVGALSERPAGGASEAPRFDGATLVDEGLRSLKDFDEPARLHRLVIPGAAEDARPLRTLEAPSNLPHESTSLVGRDAEIARLADELQKGRVVTLTGPGGSGKTRLAIGVAEVVRGGFPHGTWFVDLSAIREAAVFEPTIAQTIGIRESSDRTLAEALRGFLRDRQVLLLLDNLEQLLPPAAALTASLIRGAPGLRILATSRELLRIGGEHPYVVPPLDIGAGVALFEDRARTQRPDLVLDDATRATITEICRRLDGLPLAIELAAARIRILSPAAILERLGRSLDLAGGARDLPERQRTLRGAIDWSHELLSESERRLFRRLAIFAGGWAAESAAAVADPDGELGIDILDGLESLLDKSLIRREADSEGRLSMHVLLREYAAERLAESGELDAVAARHAAEIRAIAEREGARIVTRDAELALRRLDEEQYNVRAAVEWSVRTGDTAVGYATLGATWRWFQQRGRLREGRAWLAQLLDHPNRPPDARLRIAALAADGGLAYWMEDFESTRVRYEERLGLAQGTGDLRLVAEAQYDMGFLSIIANDPDGIRRHAQRALELFTEIGDANGIERARQVHQIEAFLVGDYQTARAESEGNLAAFREQGSLFHIADTLTLLSAIAWQANDGATAWARLMEALRIFKDLDMASGLARALGMAALILLRFGDRDLGARVAGATAALRRDKNVMIAPTRVLHLQDAVELSVEELGEQRARQLVDEGGSTPVARILEEVLATSIGPPAPQRVSAPA
ncbi:MAG TPA: adenylate/guanylate cyclase domain-containing protein [Candidatus Limnocylindrales bacterium]|nr:adenylate/guanylate cyclase domain-containing protein [Candidatus Limnocylindrales bacterium]